MRILYITFEAPSRFYGGGFGLIQSLTSLGWFAEIDYIGLEYESDDELRFHTRKTFFLKKRKNPVSCALNLVRGLPTFYYGSWKRAIKSVDPAEYDLVFTDFSHHDFVIRWAMKHGLKTITRVHNIEADMAASVKHSEKMTHYKLRAILNGNRIGKREGVTMRLSDRLLFLTVNDLARAEELYGGNIAQKSVIVPVCLDGVAQSGEKSPVEGAYALATGTLSHGANAEGIVWFLKNVWAEFGKTARFRLVVAGSHPDERVKDACASVENCVLVDTPAEIAPYFENADFYIAPIFSGAGMKVKVAEAFTYGLNVLGTDHALIGYDGAEGFFLRANTAEQFAEGLKELSSGKKADKAACKEMAKREFSLGKSAAEFERVARELLEK